MKKLIYLIFIFYCSVNIQAQLSFVSNGQRLNSVNSRGIVLADFNADGFTDAFVVNEKDRRVYMGKGNGLFNDYNQLLPAADWDWCQKQDTGDVNNDGTIDVIAGREILLNDGKGNFTKHSDLIDNSETGDLLSQFADLNSDGYLDIFAINFKAARVYLNDKTGHFKNTGQKLGDGTIGTGQIAHIALGDINNDGYIDAITAGWKWDGSTQCPNHIWLNDGKGNFHDSGQLLDIGASHVHGAALSDFNGDGKLDLAFGIQDSYRNGAVYLNNGSGVFTFSQNLPGDNGENIDIGDFNNDGFTDIFIPQSVPPSKIMLNDGKGKFSDSKLKLGNYSSWDVAIGDFNSDQKMDAFVVGPSSSSTQVWLNTTNISSVEVDKNYINFKLQQNFPNPFNPSTVISYQLLSSGDVKLKIYDSLGREIKTLINSFQNEGEHRAVWDATDDNKNPVTSGIYLYSLLADDLNIQKKMVLIR